MTAIFQNLAGFALSKMLVGIGFGMSFTSGVICLVDCWFLKHKGLLIGILSMCSGLGGSVIAIALTATTEAIGWRMTHLLLAAAMGGEVASRLNWRTKNLTLLSYSYCITGNSKPADI